VLIFLVLLLLFLIPFSVIIYKASEKGIIEKIIFIEFSFIKTEFSGTKSFFVLLLEIEVKNLKSEVLSYRYKFSYFPFEVVNSIALFKPNPDISPKK